MRFSDRLGVTQPAPSVLQVDGIDGPLLNCLWEACCEFYLKPHYVIFSNDTEFHTIVRSICIDFFKRPSDTILRISHDETLKRIRSLFFESEWWNVYNFIEFLFGLRQRLFAGESARIDERFVARISFFLEREKSGFRVLNEVLVPIVDPVEIQEISEAGALRGQYQAAGDHIQAAVSLFAKKPTPDYRNAIKEAISAVESTVRVLTGSRKATLGDGLKKLGEMKPLHPSFHQAMDKLYGYTSDEGGIRHSLIDAARIDEADAKFMIVACSAFVNFCVQRQ